MDTYYGYNLQVFLINTPVFNEGISSAIVAFSLFTSLLFTRFFLQSMNNFPKSDTYLSVIMYVFAVLCIFSLIVDNNLFMAYSTIFLVVIYSLALIYISIVSLIKKVSGSGYVLAASLLSAVSLLLSSAVATGLVDSTNFIHYFYAIAMIFNILLLSFALVSRSEDVQSQNETVIKKEHEMVNKLDSTKDELMHLNEKLKRKLDIREKQLLEKELEFEQFSIKDNVTGLYNRVKLEELLLKELHRSKRYNHEFSLIIINIDSMKIINDSHGHEVGNSVIKEMSDLLMNHIRYIDIVGRWSDDEYLIICPETNLKNATLAAQHLQKLVQSNKFFFVGGVTVSLGVTVCQEDDTEKYIIQRAYEALAKAKENGRNRVETA
jgi:diguanylate cyclase (GGDEF)-like protein